MSDKPPSEHPQLLALDSLLPGKRTVVRLLEPQQSCIDSLREQLFAGTYNKPFILDRGRWRYLHFDIDAVQSAMNVEHPDRLSLSYTRKMMAFLIFNGAPRRILLLGLGGGSLAKFCYRHLPSAAITTIELNPDVIALRDAFRIPADDTRFRVIRADGASYTATRALRKDVILADACNRTGIAPGHDVVEFYQSARRRLSAGGVFVMNLCGDREWFTTHLAKIRHVFGEIVTLPGPRNGNLIVFAFRKDVKEFCWQDLESRAIRLKRRFGLQFPLFVQRMAREWERRGGSTTLL